MASKFKITIGIIGILLTIGCIFFLQIKDSQNKKQFFENSFSSPVINSSSYQGRSIEYHLKNGLKIYFMPSSADKVAIGDLIQKQSKTYQYSVYRKCK